MRSEHSRHALLSAILLLSAAAACGGDDDAAATLTYEEACAIVPGCAEPRYDESQPKETIFRVRLVRDATGDARIGGIEEIEVFEEVGVPRGSLGGSHLLLGLDASDTPVDGQVLHFPDELTVTFTEDWDHEHRDLSGREVDVFAYVRNLPEVESLALIDESGALVEKVPAEATVPDEESEAGEIGSSEEPLLELPTHCGHVLVLEGEADRNMAINMEYFGDTELEVPGPTQRAVIEGAFARMTPLLCHSVSRLALGYIEGADGVGGVVKQLDSGDLVLLNTAVYPESQLAANEELRLRMMHTIIHEAGHSLEALLNSEGINLQTYNGKWPLENRSFAAKTVDFVRTRWGFGYAWLTMHKTFIDAGFAVPYGEPAMTIAQVRAWGRDETVNAGFMSRYAGKLYEEDIADTTAWTYMGQLYQDAGIPDGVRQKEDFGCQVMQQHGERSVPGRLSPVYTKLMFLKDLGAVHPDDVERCTGENLGLPLDSPGFHIYQESTLLSSFEDDLQAQIGTRTDTEDIVFEMKGAGEATFGDDRYPATFKLLLDLTQGVPGGEVGRIYANPPWPRGIYPLALAGTNQFELRLDGAPSGNFDVSDGLVLVAEASNKRIAGSVFIREVWRLNAPVPVPEVYDPPLTVRFLIER